MIVIDESQSSDNEASVLNNAQERMPQEPITDDIILNDIPQENEVPGVQEIKQPKQEQREKKPKKYSNKLIRRVFRTNSSNQKMITIPNDYGIEAGDYVRIEKVE